MLVLVLFGWWLAHRNRYFVLRTDWQGPVKERIIYLPTRQINHPKLRTEVKIFNRLCLVMPTVGGVAVAYTKHLRALLADPRHKPGVDPYDKLFYGYACAVLLTKTTDPIVARQLRKNLLFLFAPQRKIVKRIKAVWTNKYYELYPTPIYKIFNDGYADPREPEFTTDAPLQTTVLGSYIKYHHANLTIKQFANFYELSATTEQTVTFTVAKDKQDYDCQIARGVVTCKNLLTGQTRTYAFRGEKIRLFTSMCAKTDALKIGVTWQGVATVSINHGRRQLLTAEELAFNHAVEDIVNQAYRAKYVQGERLRARYQAAEQCVPSLKLLTKVVPLTQPDDFFQILDQLPYYQKAAQLFGGFNLVFLYAGTNKFVADLVAGFLTDNQVETCRQQNLLLFFIDRTVVTPDALYFFTKLTKPTKYTPPAPMPYRATVSRTYPYVQRVVLSNPTPQPVTLTAPIPLVFAAPSVVSAQGTTLTVVGLYSGRVSTYKLPVPLHLENEWLTTHLNLPVKVKLMGFEQKVYQIQRHEQNANAQERRKNFVASLTQIVIKTADKKLEALFAKPVVDGQNPVLLNLVKAAYKNVDKKLLISLLEDKHSLTVDVWQYLLTKLVGVRLLRGKVHLVPCVNIMGDFTLEFVCNGEKYLFNTRKDLPNSQKIVKVQHG